MATKQHETQPAHELEDLEAMEAAMETYGAATQRFDSWVAGAQALALFQAAFEAGIIAAARRPSTPAEIAAVTGLDPRRVTDICLALHAYEVLDRQDDGYCLTNAFATLSAPDAWPPLAARLAGEHVITQVLAHATTACRAYTALAPQEMVSLATMVSPLPALLRGRAWVASFYRTFPELRVVLAAGGRYLAAGCGAGGSLLSTLALFPAATGVGLEISGPVLAEAERNAQAAGVADRVELRHADARDLQEEAAFDVAWWSQFYFPAASRAAALAAIRRALKPGGYLYLPCFWGGEPRASPEALREPGGRFYARNKLVFGTWRVPALTRDELRAEVESAGFTVLRTAPVPGIELLLAQRPATTC